MTFPGLAVLQRPPGAGLGPPLDLPLRYTLCFLTRADSVLMLHRRQPPNQGLWNGVGGRVEPGEPPLAACLREVQEETGYCLPVARFAGLLTWEGYEIEAGGLYLYTAAAPAGEPCPCPEGELRWQPWTWVLSSPDVVGNLHYVGPAVRAARPARWHHFRYRAGEIAGYIDWPVPAGFALA
jgi:8-oxo-dGTP diphosphatase